MRRPEKKQEIVTHIPGGGGGSKQQTACDTDLVLGLTKKDVKVAIINMFTAQKEVGLEKYREV